jgi:TonB-dependent SusC/RagA subfamily outer membrane receptor
MRRFFLLSVLLFTSLFSIAQKPLTDSRRSSFYTYIYRVSDEAVLLFLKHKQQDIKEDALKDEVAKFPTDRPEIVKLPPGNYLKVTAISNKLSYTLIQKRTVNLALLENGFDIRIVLTNEDSHEIIDAQVSSGKEQIQYDNTSQTYRTKRSKGDTIIRVFYKGISNFYPIGELKDRNYNTNSSPQKGGIDKVWQKITTQFKNLFGKSNKKELMDPTAPNPGFIVLNKPKYKPGDTVKFKAFILDKKSKKPIDDKLLLVRLAKGYNESEKIIGYVNAYRKGAFDFEFKLDKDSLGLVLDQSYTISLETPDSKNYVIPNTRNYQEIAKMRAKRTVYQTGYFRYEDYELKSSVFTNRVDRNEHSPGRPISVYFKATDDNGLNVPDGRVMVTLYSPQTREQHDGKNVFVPDTLWQHQVTLDALGETKLVIPDSIFPKVKFNYTAKFVFLNSNNESREASKSLTWDYHDRKIETKVELDTLKINYLIAGKSKPATGQLLQITEQRDTLRKQVDLPAAIVMNANISSYIIKVDSLIETVSASMPRVSLSGYHTADSLFINVANPGKLKFWYTIFAGNKIYDQGATKEFVYKQRFKYAGRVTVVAHYLSNGVAQYSEQTMPYLDKYLKIDVKQPITVFPGQQAEVEVAVKDYAGKPVANADLTAYGVTGKFDNYRAPEVPYLGKLYPYRSIKPPLVNKPFDNTQTVKLNWQYWSKNMGLDSIKYYQFTHTDSIYKITEPAPDLITQIAPFVVSNGDIEPVHILYVDDMPVYFSQSQHMQRYSFEVKPGKHFLRFRTANYSIRMNDPVEVAADKKLILSINADPEKNKTATFRPMPDSLVTYEADLINKYMVSIVPNFGYHLATLTQGNRMFLLNYNPNNYYDNYRQANILAGPFAGYNINLDIKDGISTTFLGEAGYSFEFQPGLIKQRSLPYKYPFATKLKGLPGNADYRQYVLTGNDVDSIEQNYEDEHVRLTLPVYGGYQQRGGRLMVRVDKFNDGKIPFVKSIIIYKNDDPDYQKIFSGLAKDLGRFEPGKYRLLYLFKGNSYYLQENVIIKPNGINFYGTGIINPHVPDSMSLKIAKKIITPNLGYMDNGAAQAIKEAFNDKYLDITALSDEMTGHVLDKVTKERLTGASIKVVGTPLGMQADIQGFFRIKVPKKGQLSFQYVGYTSQQINIEPGRHVTVYLSAVPLRSLQDVVIRGYVKRNREQTTGSSYIITGKEIQDNPVGNVEQLLQGKVAGLNIQNNTGAPGMRGSVNIRGLSTVVATGAGTGPGNALYVIDGVISDGGGFAKLSQEEIVSMSILTDASATALYGARGANGVIIITTKKGNAFGADGQSQQPSSMRHNFSDYAYWYPRLVTDADGKAKFKVTYPDDITNWRTFVIGMTDKRQSGMEEGQVKAFKPLSANLTTPLFAVRGDTFSALGKLLNYTTDTITLNRRFSYNDKVIADGNITLQNARIDTFKLVADGKDTLSFEYTLKRSSGYFDGEKRVIPMFERGSLETKGMFSVLEHDTTITLQFNPNLKEATLRAEASVLPVLLEETEYLRNYEYLCNEQLASKLKGLLAQKQIRTYLNQPFKWDKEVNDIIKKLTESRRGEGTWGWWKDTPEELWISLHATEALLKAETLGYKVDQQKLRKDVLIAYLIRQQYTYNAPNKLTNIAMLKALGSVADLSAMVTDYERTLPATPRQTDYDKYTLMLTRQMAGMPVVIDSLLKDMKHTMFGNVYWGTSGYQFFNNSVQLSLLAYRILKNEGRHPQLLAKLRYYFMEQRSNGQWSNTYQSAQILEVVLPDMLVGGQQPRPAQLVLTGDKAETVTRFPYTTTLSGNARVTVRKTGDMPVYLTAYQKFWNPEPKKVSDAFTVDTWFQKGADKITKLKGGEAVTINAEVAVKADADYVMIEIPIPAGCSYDGKEQGYYNGEVHREYFKNKVSIFCRKLTTGRYSFAIKLMPRYSGSYHLNPAKAEMMYFPVFYGREGMKTVEVGN